MSDYFINKDDNKGYLEITLEFIKMMTENATIAEVDNFLYDLGFRLSSRYDVCKATTLTQMQLVINQHLSKLGFGVCQIEDQNDSLKITHRGFQTCQNSTENEVLIKGFSVILCGLYNGWFKQTGMPEAITCKIENINYYQDIVLIIKRQK